ncbi:hypothetical protein QBC46DRAFT_407739 [Diplogelasinospora grovesii]|uniref:Uncharacterized protein n=1 Tax=Diplogelasinospora grovesii TaxID=303347 RepID=A0AAN6S5W8_9PEZI|nr:hypothetical protein QBC46DRAFT_407739 [Diplogelasinospora grovesii]
MTSLNLRIDALDSPASDTLSEEKSGSHSTTFRGRLVAWLKSLTGTPQDQPGVSRSARATDFSETRVATLLRDYVQPEFKGSLKDTAESILVLLPANAQYSGKVFSKLCLEIATQIPYNRPSQQKVV